MAFFCFSASFCVFLVQSLFLCDHSECSLLNLLSSIIFPYFKKLHGMSLPKMLLSVQKVPNKSPPIDHSQGVNKTASISIPTLQRMARLCNLVVGCYGTSEAMDVEKQTNLLGISMDNLNDMVELDYGDDVDVVFLLKTW